MVNSINIFVYLHLEEMNIEKFIQNNLYQLKQMLENMKLRFQTERNEVQTELKKIPIILFPKLLTEIMNFVHVTISDTNLRT